MPDGDGPIYFFMHIMKTAGTSLAWQLDKAFPPQAIYPTPGSHRHMDEYWKIDEVRALSDAQRRPIRLFHGHFPSMLGDMVGADRTITLLRDPVERTLSHIRHCERHFPQHHGKPLEQIYEDDWHHPLLFRDYQVKQFALTAADEPKGHTDVIDVDDERVGIAREALERVTHLGLTDRYDELIDDLRRATGWPIHSGPRLQVGDGDRDDADVGDLRERIAHDSAADVAFYAFAVDLYDRRRAARHA